MGMNTFPLFLLASKKWKQISEQQKEKLFLYFKIKTGQHQDDIQKVNE